MAELSKYGPWVGGDDWRSWVGLTVTSSTATQVTFKVRGWMDVGAGGDSDNASNIKGWVGYELNGKQTWGSEHNVGDFDPNGGWYYDTGKSWTISRTKSDQTLWGGAWVQAYAGVYNGSVSKAWVSVNISPITHYTVSFNANGGSGAPSAQTKWYGETLALSSTKPTRTGYTFSGWNTKSDGSGTNYASGGNYTGNAALTLYAKWTAITYTITYKSNYTGGAADQTQSKTYGVNATIKAANTFSRTHYSFKTWNTAANGSGSTVAAGSTYSTNAALTLYAQWQIITFQVTYNANGGSGAPAAQTKNSGTNITLSKTAPSRTGYTFLGWAMSSTATEPAAASANYGNKALTAANMAAGVTYSGNAALTLYAVWKVAAPTLDIVSVYRADDSWNPSDDGKKAIVTVNAESRTGSNLSFSCTVGNTTVSSPSATSGTMRTFQLNPNLSADQSYAVSVTTSDTNGSTTKTSVIQTAWYAIDILRGGHGIAFGKTSSVPYLADFGMAVRSDTGMTIAHGDTSKSATFTSTRSDTNKSISFGVGDDGVNRGIWDVPLNKWVLYVDSSGNTNVSGLTTGSIPSLAADKISSGTFDAARIPSLAASKIGSGQLAVARGGTGAATASANKVFAGPSSGSAAAPSFRSLETADLPTVSFTSLGTTSGEKTININCSGYAWILVRAYYSTTYWSTIIVPTGQLDASTYRDFYLGGGWWSSGYGASFKAIKTKFTPYKGVVGSTTREMNWAIWGIK